MEKQNEQELFKQRSLEALQAARDAVGQSHLEAGVSRVYYACYYAIHSRLSAMGALPASHKQTGIRFRELFIKTGKLDKKFSDILTELSEWRMDVDYSPLPEITSEKAKELIAQAEMFVNALLSDS